MSGLERTIVVAFGSNVGERRDTIAQSAAAVAGVLQNFTLSSVIETAPVGAGLENDPPFLNAVGVGTSELPPRELLERLRGIEQRFGRERPYPGAPRTLDLDLILAGDEIVNEPDLQVPHPRFRDRLFVLEPLVEIAPELRDPLTGLTMRALLENKKGRV